MRTTLAAVSVLLGSLSAQAADVYPPRAVYGAAPPPAITYEPPPPAVVYGPPPAYAYAPPPYYPPPPHARPPAIIVAPEGPAYLVPGPAYQATDEHLQNQLLVDGRRYYRRCWWDFGATRCSLRAKAWYW